MPEATKDEVDLALKSLSDVLNAVEKHYNNAGTLFDFVSREKGAPALLDVLRKGAMTLADEQARLRKVASAQSKLKARLPRGFSDRRPAEIDSTRKMIDSVRTVYERYGFEPVETPFAEYTETLGKFLPDQDPPNEGVFSLQDDDEQ